MHTTTQWRRRVGEGFTTLLAIVLAASCATTPTGEEVGDRGTAAAHPAPHSPPPAPPLRAGERFAQIHMPESYTPAAPAGGTDEYRCFLIDPKLTSDAFLTGSQFLPQNLDIVHHAIFFRIDDTAVTAARKRDTATPGPGWTCFGDADVGDKATWVASWAPGGQETLLSPEVGYPMPAGSQLIMQVHYNLLTVDQKGKFSDQSGIRLRLTETALTPLHTTLLPAPVELPCTAAESGPLCDRDAAVTDVTRRFGDGSAEAAAGLLKLCSGGKPSPSNEQHCDHVVKQSGMRVYGLGGHMHLLGRSIKVELNPGTPTARTLLDVPTYNFDDQRLRVQDSPVAIKAGDTLRVTCTHDAELRRQLPQLRSLPARYVIWGQGTADEMCLAILVGTKSSA
ncbi:monooxygenase [Actinoplanes sp. NEAU-A12]|uniref:Monooxygenase n=1 Tax=Actinoplanes sandaracinus TaxID=3045177 RepID=A0ABT6WY58_9ACTN|nr:monooxygenase [Actinoplanes sandaracinus]MDI6104669.1 monooxygenase [Actinoplanes sandaracinus]